MPFAVWLVLAGISSTLLFERPESFFDAQWGKGFFDLTALLVAIYASEKINAYYESHLGRVRPRRQGRKVRGPLILVAALALAVVIGLPSVREGLGVGVLGVTAGTFAAGFILYSWWPMRDMMTFHWPIIAFLILAVSILPLFGAVSLDGLPLFMSAVGALLAAGFVLDHLLVTRTLKHVPEDADAV